MSGELTRHVPGGALDAYDPTEGLKAITVAEAAEKYFARAKDATGLREAIEAKLGEQRRFVLWWDGQEKAAGARGKAGPGRGNKTASQGSNAVLTIADLGLDRDTVSRWRKRLKDPHKFDAALEAATERCRKVCEAEAGAGNTIATKWTGDTESYTPAEYIEAARVVLGAIDLDPASSAVAQETVQAAKWYGPDEDGLEQPWLGRVWLNPPYAYPTVAEFIARLLQAHGVGEVPAAILLTNNNTDTRWWHGAADRAAAICLTLGRINFYKATGEITQPTNGQSFFYFGEDPESFAKIFRKFGLIVAAVRG